MRKLRVFATLAALTATTAAATAPTAKADWTYSCAEAIYMARTQVPVRNIKTCKRIDHNNLMLRTKWGRYVQVERVDHSSSKVFMVNTFD